MWYLLHPAHQVQVSEELNSVETDSKVSAIECGVEVSEELNSVETIS